MAEKRGASGSDADIRKVTLHLSLDLRDEKENLLAEIIDGLPHGFKFPFCQHLMLSALPQESEDADITALLSEFIRARGRKGKKRVAQKAPATPAVKAALTDAERLPTASSEAPKAVVGDAGAQGGQHQDSMPVAPKGNGGSGLGAFTALAGGDQWGSQ